MAAEFVLTFAAEGILTKVSALAAQELTLAWGFKAELKKLGESLNIIQDFLYSAADQKPQDQGKAVEEWVKKLKDIAQDADDVLDEFNYELLRRKVELRNHMKRKVLNFLSPSNPLLFRVKMAHKIKKINDSLVELKNQAALINLVAKRRDSRPGRERADRDQTDSFFEPDEKVIGREDIERNIVETLVSSNNEQNDLSTVAIVGMPGLGKTTLAKSVYNKPAIATHFHRRIWVCVSNTFDVDTILSQMVDSLVPGKAGMKSQDALIKVLREELTGKRYVLVLDDVWNEDSGKWESLKSCLSKLGSNRGSSIIVTTRSAGVASVAETLPRPKLRILSNDECWSILKQRACNRDDNYCLDTDRERIGRAIAEKCGGIPLVAKVLGSVMHSRASKDEWLSIRDNKIWELHKEEDRIMSVLKLSFDNLKSPLLKQCFAYCSMLRKDFEIERDELVQLWMAQGLLQSSTDKIHIEPAHSSTDKIDHHEMEDTGNEYFNILLQNSLLQEVTDGGVLSKYTMHDLVHDLAEEVSRYDSLTRDSNDTCGVRHVACIPPSTLKNMSDATVGRLRSIVSNEEVPEIIFSKFKAMRVLSLYAKNIEELPNSFGKLKHLRYLNLSKTRIRALPKSTGKLYNLQTLRMENDYLKELPREMQNLINLRHLYVEKETKFPAGMLRGLTNLQTLSCCNLGKEMGCRIEELGGLNQLRGSLSIRNLENVRDEEESKKAKLEEKKNMVELRLVFSRDRPINNINDEKVLEGLRPHTMLESLTIERFMGDRFPSWMMKNPFSLKNLKKLVLEVCHECGELPMLGHLPFLGYLRIHGMNNLKRLGISEIYGYDYVYKATAEKETIVLFPALKTLRIQDCDELTEWMEAPPTTRKVEVFPSLEELRIEWCPRIGSIPIADGMTSLRHLSIEYCDSLSSIGLLDHCTSLQELRIEDCKSLTSIPISQGLPSLRELDLSYCDGLSSLPSGIESCTSLQKLRIVYCDSLSSIGLLDHCTSLRELSISNCVSLTSIPISQGLPSLRELDLSYCDGLSSLPSGIERCTSLERLYVSGCENLATISFTRVLPSLRNIRVRYCSNLSCLPLLEYCPSLRQLSVWECPKLASISFSTDFNPCHCLERLEIEWCKGLQSLPDLRSFTSLRELSIVNCAGIESLVSEFHIPMSLEKLWIIRFDNLECIPSLEEYTSLRELYIFDCEKLKSLPTGLSCLVRLEKLELGPFWEELDSFPDIQVSSQHLASLQLCGWPKIKSLPQQVQHLTSLTTLIIRLFNGVETLPEWLGNLTSLVELNIYNCDSLKYLPSLTAMQRLTKLQSLFIQDCPHLKERCTKDSGEEWPKISHIPDISIDY